MIGSGLSSLYTNVSDLIKSGELKEFLPIIGDVFKSHVSPSLLTGPTIEEVTDVKAIVPYEEDISTTILDPENIIQREPTVEDLEDEDNMALQVITPSPNASFGVGNLGPKELAPAFIGDRQELLEDLEIVQHNPAPLQLMPKIKKSKKLNKRELAEINRRIDREENDYEGILRDRELDLERGRMADELIQEQLLPLRSLPVGSKLHPLVIPMDQVETIMPISMPMRQMRKPKRRFKKILICD